jgi:hypothetical protein
VRVGGSSAALATIAVGSEWQTATVSLPTTPSGEDVVVELTSTIFLGGPRELALRQQASQQLRLLGACIDWATLDARPAPAEGAAASTTCERASTEPS